MKTKYQIYCDRHDGLGLSLDGCWGSEDAKFDGLAEAQQAADFLAKNYSECEWVVCDQEMTALYRTNKS